MGGQSQRGVSSISTTQLIVWDFPLLRFLLLVSFRGVISEFCNCYNVSLMFHKVQSNYSSGQKIFVLAEVFGAMSKIRCILCTEQGWTNWGLKK